MPRLQGLAGDTRAGKPQPVVQRGWRRSTPVASKSGEREADLLRWRIHRRRFRTYGPRTAARTGSRRMLAGSAVPQPLARNGHRLVQRFDPPPIEYVPTGDATPKPPPTTDGVRPARDNTAPRGRVLRPAAHRERHRAVSSSPAGGICQRGAQSLSRMTHHLSAGNNVPVRP
jgi:hypothetical protein